MGRNVGRSRTSLTRVRLEHHQSAPKLHPEEQQITQEDKREGGNGSGEAGGGGEMGGYVRDGKGKGVGRRTSRGQRGEL